MNILRRIEYSINQYQTLLLYDVENAKKYCTEYINDIEILTTVLDAYIDDTSKKFQIWCDNCVKVFDSSLSANTIFSRTILFIKMKIVNHFLNTGSYKLSRAGNLQRKLEKIKIRFAQFQFFN